MSLKQMPKKFKAIVISSVVVATVSTIVCICLLLYTFIPRTQTKNIDSLTQSTETKNPEKFKGLIITYEADADIVTESEMNTAVDLIKTRLTDLGYTEATITRHDDNNKRIIIKIPGEAVESAVSVVEKLGTQGKLEFADANGVVLMEGTSEYIKNATPEYDATNGDFVQLEFTDKGKEAFAKVTAQTVGSQLFINLDGVPQSAPMVEEVINSNTCIIRGNFTAEDASWLANTIKAGQFPFKLKLVSTSEAS